MRANFYLENSLGKVSFTIDMWSDPDLKPYMAVTAHWLKLVQEKLTLRAELIGFLHLSETHSRERLAESFYFIITRMGLGKKVSILFIYI